MTNLVDEAGIIIAIGEHRYIELVFHDISPFQAEWSAGHTPVRAYNIGAEVPQTRIPAL